METYHIHINGVVQGVGFRSLVYKLAGELHLKGMVKNGNDGLHIFVNASLQEARLFYNRILASPPGKAIILGSHLESSDFIPFEDFSIRVEQDSQSHKQALISPDLALCQECRNELRDPLQRRFRYPFITCTQCGPRYSILNALPYERHATAMKAFEMCPECEREYQGVADRRFFSQTNSCGVCGIEMRFYHHPDSILFNKTREVLEEIQTRIRQGHTIALKGIGGYLLLCKADDPLAIRKLRERKHRPEKPFALLYPDIPRIKADFILSPSEEFLLKSPAAPLVLLTPRNGIEYKISTPDIAPGLKKLAVMIPYSPLLELVAGDYGHPLVATSANISGSPILYQDEEALEHLFDFSEGVVSYNRVILVPQDDSLVQVCPHSGQRIILRRSRGYAPSLISYRPLQKSAILATGAHIKCSFALTIKDHVFVSPFLGNGESYETQVQYQKTLDHAMKVYAFRPTRLVSDMHPAYFSHRYTRELAVKWNLVPVFIQHHEAHFAAVLAENDLLDSGPVLGVIWDGLGWGRDGNLWGGEFYLYHQQQINRFAHFNYFPSIAQDKMSLEPRIAALCLAGSLQELPDFFLKKFSTRELKNYQVLMTGTKMWTSSVGRIFDGVASLLDVCDRQSYEGEAAMRLQSLAEEYTDRFGLEMDSSYFPETLPGFEIPTGFLFQGICQDILVGKQRNYIAAKFHFSLASLAGIVAKKRGIRKIGFSGGVFQNALLVDWIVKLLQADFELYFHRELSPNDENISFGQLVYLDQNLHSGEIRPDDSRSWQDKSFIEKKS